MIFLTFKISHCIKNEHFGITITYKCEKIDKHLKSWKSLKFEKVNKNVRKLCR